MHWRGLSAAHCKACCEHFKSDAAFEKHRVGDFDDAGSRQCLTPEELRKPRKNGKQVLYETARGWVTERMPETVVAARASQG